MGRRKDATRAQRRRPWEYRGPRFLLILMLTSLLLEVLIKAGFESIETLTSNGQDRPETLFKVPPRKKQLSVKVKVLLSETVQKEGLEIAKSQDPRLEPPSQFPQITSIQEMLQNRSNSTSESSSEHLTIRKARSTNTNSNLVNLDSLHFETPLSFNIVVLTLSGRRNFRMRQAVRRTWKNRRKNVFFVIGNRGCAIPRNYRREHECVLARSFSPVPNETRMIHMKSLKREQEQLKEEFETYNDMVFVDMVDVYRNLPRKLKLGYKWAVKETSANWILKADDDSYVHVSRLGRLLKHHKPVRTVLGEILTNWIVPRAGKWAELNYKNAKYPPFPIGSSGHIVSRDVAHYVVKSDQFEYQGEDTSLGIWLEGRADFPGVKFIHSRVFTNRKNCRDGISIVVGHDLTPQEMKLCDPKGHTPY